MDSKTVIGITGYIGSGKSFVAEIFAKLGAKTQDSDGVTHNLLKSTLKDSLIKEFGTNDRKELASIVFSDDAKLKELENIIHPAVRQRNLEFIESIDSGIIVLEIPLLFETKAQEICDYTIFVNVSRETSLKRSLARSNMSIVKWESIFNKQSILPDKGSLADFIIENEDDSDIVMQVERIYKKICEK